jgi:predicted CXXCH cytochrome family protein
LTVQTHSLPSQGLLLVALASVAVGTACSNDDIVYDNLEPFNPPADGGSGFLGYYVAAEKQTLCGNCHANLQASWMETAHADAWAGLQSSDHADAFCEECHAVTELGNSTTVAGGYNVVPDASYHDVQCESCHGPGVDHLGDPSRAKPLASIAAAEDASNGCGECHNGEHHPFVEQWSESAHGNVNAYPQGEEGCNECHEGQTALEALFGVTSDNAEKASGELMDITCAICHDPHGGPHPGQLRAPVTLANENNLCVKCHNNRAVPEVGSTRGAHAAQGPLVFGEGIGWLPPGFEALDGLTGSHGNPQANPGLCATCHVASFTVTEPEFFQSVGHSFEAVPCLDEDGFPVSGPCTNDERSFTACTPCHGTAANSMAIYEDLIDDIGELLAQIWIDSNGNGHVDPSPADGGLLADIVASAGAGELDAADAMFTFAEGVLFNAQLAATDATPRFWDVRVVVAANDTVNITAHDTSGNGVHNPPFLKALLRASITAGADHYGVAAAK